MDRTENYQKSKAYNQEIQSTPENQLKWAIIAQLI